MYVLCMLLTPPSLSPDPGSSFLLCKKSRIGLFELIVVFWSGKRKNLTFLCFTGPVLEKKTWPVLFEGPQGP